MSSGSLEDLAAFLDEVRRRLALQAESSGVVVASVVRARGSTPRKAGARMLIDPSTGSTGTIGGGCGEAEVLGRAQRTLATGESQLVEVSLLEEDGFDSPSICGGVLDVFLEKLDGRVGGVAADEFFGALDELRNRGRLAVVTVTAGPSSVGRKTLIDEQGGQRFSVGSAELDDLAREAAAEALSSGTAGTSWDGDVAVYAEPLREAAEVVVVGAGHVGAAVCSIAARAGFSVTVLDDRASFANPARLPDATRILVGDPRERLCDLAGRPDRHIVLVTRGHRLDAECLEVALAMKTAYLGMIGSKRRVRRIREWLLEKGTSEVDLARLHAPIGLDIAAETPGEIAVAIVGEIIAERRRRSR